MAAHIRLLWLVCLGSAVQMEPSLFLTVVVIIDSEREKKGGGICFGSEKALLCKN